MSDDIGAAVRVTLKRHQKDAWDRLCDNLESYLWMGPAPPEGYVPPPPEPPPPYVPSDRATQLLKDLRRAERKGKRGKALLAIIDALIDDVADEERERWSDY